MVFAPTDSLKMNASPLSKEMDFESYEVVKREISHPVVRFVLNHRSCPERVPAKADPGRWRIPGHYPDLARQDRHTHQRPTPGNEYPGAGGRFYQHPCARRRRNQHQYPADAHRRNWHGCHGSRPRWVIHSFGYPGRRSHSHAGGSCGQPDPRSDSAENNNPGRCGSHQHCHGAGGWSSTHPGARCRWNPHPRGRL